MNRPALLSAFRAIRNDPRLSDARRSYLTRLFLGQTPAEARAEQRRIRGLARRVAHGEETRASALASLGGGL